jgi:hypothetical protein
VTTSSTPADEAAPARPTGRGNGRGTSTPTITSPPRRASKRGRAAARRQAATQAPPTPPAAPTPPPEVEMQVNDADADAAAPGAPPTAGPPGGVVGEFVGMVASGGFTAAPPAAPAAEVEPEADVEPDAGDGRAPADGPRARGPRHHRRSRRAQQVVLRRRIVAGAMVVLVALGAGLVVVGLDRVRGSTAGTYVDATLQPDEPGYVALVTPTPTMLLLQTDAGGELAGVALLALRSQDDGGSVVLVPVATQAPFAEEGTSLFDVYADGGADTVATQLELMLDIAVGDTVVLDPDGWGSLVAPVGSISLVLDAPVGEWPAGRVDLPADEAGTYVVARELDESELARVDRQQVFWQEWLPRVAAEGEDALPGESDVGIGRFVRGLAAGSAEVVALPVAQVQPSDAELFELNDGMAAELIAREVPFPQEPSAGSRVRVRLLNGTSTPDLAALAAGPLVAAGAEIALSGNASSFDEPETRIIYGRSRLRQEANNLRDALGVGVVEQAADESVEPADEADRIDVTVVLGADAPDGMRRLESTG